MKNSRFRLFSMRALAAAGPGLFAAFAQAQVCNVQPAFPGRGTGVFIGDVDVAS